MLHALMLNFRGLSKKKSWESRDLIYKILKEYSLPFTSYHSPECCLDICTLTRSQEFNHYKNMKLKKKHKKTIKCMFLFNNFKIPFLLCSLQWTVCYCP